MAHEGDPGIFGGRPEFHSHVAPRKVAKSGYCDWSGKRALAARN
jgi:hypothetical protein